MRPNRWSTRLITLVLAVAAMSASSTGATSAGDACFKQVFQKRDGDATWLVRECKDGVTLRYRIAYRIAHRTAQAGAAAADINMDEIDGIVGVAYRVVGPATFLLDAPAERGGRAYLLHPVEGRPALSVAAFRYMGDDEESLAVRLDGRHILATTGRGKHLFDIAPNGTLTRAVTTGKPQRPLD